MKKTFAVLMCIILVLAIPMTASARGSNGTTDKETKIREVEMQVSILPETINEGDEVILTFTVPRSGSAWMYGETTGLLKPKTVFDEETGTYITTALLDTATAGTLEVNFEFIMIAGKSHHQFTGSYTDAIEVMPLNKGPAVDYSWNQDFSDNANGWSTGATSGTVTLTDGAALLKPGINDVGSSSFFDGSSGEWPGDWYASIKVFLNPETMTEGEGFTYIVAINNESSMLLAKYGFTAAGTGSAVEIGCTDSDITALVEKAGWYTLQHRFFDNNCFLTVEMSVLDGANVICSETVTSSYAIPGDVGGSRYAKFTIITDDDGVLIDDFQKYTMP